MRSLLIVAVLAAPAFADDPNLPPPPIPQQLDPPLLDQPRSGPPDPASTTLPSQGPPYERMFDSLDAFDSRRTTHPFGLMLEMQFARVLGQTVPSMSLLLAAPFSPRFGRLRIGLGSYLAEGEAGDITSENYDPSNLRLALGWERWAFCLRRTVCPGIAADISYAFVDPLDGTLLTPHGVIDFKTKRAKGLGIRLGGGPTILMATKTSSGRDRFDVGFSIYVNLAGWAAF